MEILFQRERLEQNMVAETEYGNALYKKLKKKGKNTRVKLTKELYALLHNTSRQCTVFFFSRTRKRERRSRYADDDRTSIALYV